jgi:hypothetical protein
VNEAKRSVLITGAAGRVATILREHWQDRYVLRLTDVRPVEAAGGHETFVTLDITDLNAFTAACDGIDTVVHLAADPSPAADLYESLLDRNLIGGYNGFEAARRAGCRRLVFASSVNAVLGYGQTQAPATWGTAPPSTRAATGIRSAPPAASARATRRRSSGAASTPPTRSPSASSTVPRGTATAGSRSASRTTASASNPRMGPPSRRAGTDRPPCRTKPRSSVPTAARP